jgi:hypothetical protein
MSRGKYQNSAEARRAREGALSEVEAGRRQIVRLTNENRELRETLASERAQHSSTVKELNAHLQAGTSAEVVALREKLRREEARLSRSRAEIAYEVVRFMNARAGRPTNEVLIEAAAHFGFGVQWSDSDSRESRRLTPRKMRAFHNQVTQLRGRGYTDASVS